jgi:hypothetical protein
VERFDTSVPSLPILEDLARISEELSSLRRVLANEHEVVGIAVEDFARRRVDFVQLLEVLSY